ncbi:MAG TPA: hypothetical protein VK572_06060 [Burkholderiales bacterium]|nr:hypothetical protein [Burkholderiales bacterium]
MSRLFSDRLLIALAPDSLVLLRLKGPRVVEKHKIACDPAFGAEPWQAAVATLARLIEPIRDAKVEVTVVLSNHFARYALVPKSEALANATEETAFVRYCFSKIHGERSKEWDVRLSRASSGLVRIASAVDSKLIEAIRSSFPTTAKAKLVSVQPFLMSAFNQWRSLLSGKGARAWILLVESQRACLAHFEDNRWTAVRNTRGSFEGPEQWAELLDRERQRDGGAGAGTPEGVYVHAPQSSKASFAETRGWTFSKLTLAPVEGLAPADADPFAMALCAR